MPLSRSLTPFPLPSFPAVPLRVSPGLISLRAATRHSPTKAEDLQRELAAEFNENSSYVFTCGSRPAKRREGAGIEARGREGGGRGSRGGLLTKVLIKRVFY